MPSAGVDYPARYADFLACFGDDPACLDYLDWLRWPWGEFVCPFCQGTSRWMVDHRWRCSSCRRWVSATAGTLFARTRTPLTVWFEAAWRMTTSKNGLSALELQRTLGLGSYQTAWSMLHRYRIAMGTGMKDRLEGRVEVDETLDRRTATRRHRARCRWEDSGGHCRGTGGTALAGPRPDEDHP